MKRQAVVLSAALAVIGAGLVVVSSNAQQPGAPTGTLELVQRFREQTFKNVDNPPLGGGPQAPSPGDMAIIGGTLRDTSNQRAGKLHAVFMRLKGRRRNIVDQVSATFVVKGGHIVVAGISDQGRTDDVAITGGTGNYAGAGHDAGHLHEEDGALPFRLHRLIRLAGMAYGVGSRTGAGWPGPYKHAAVRGIQCSTPRM
jgi:hypothetical protein